MSLMGLNVPHFLLLGYYNEARILDPDTLDTAVVLPNMPGAVNSFLSGRTYPLEGTTVMFPQYAPYTDPVTLLVCGGSGIDNQAGQALDNCVSIQPEVENAQWTIERMVSICFWRQTDTDAFCHFSHPNA